MSEFKDPLHEWGKRQQEEGMNRALQGFRQTAQHERMLQNRIFHFFTIGIIKFLWQHSRTALFLFVIPFWLYLFSWIGVIGATSSSQDKDSLGAVIGFGCFALICLLAMAGSMWYGYQKTVRFSRIVAILQMVTGGLFTLIGTYRAVAASPHGSPYKPESAECGIAMLLMMLFFIVAVATDLIQTFLNWRTGE